MTSQRYRNASSDSMGRDRVPSDDGYYQGMLKAMDGRKDERDRVQKKTFTKWVNKHLIKSQRHVTDLYEDLRDGHNLISLLEVLSGDHLPREKGRMRFHKLQNVQIALDFLRHRQVKLVNIRNDDIADGNPKLTLGLIWTIILHFQVSCSISDIHVNGQSEDMTAKEKLLLWSQRMTENYQGIRCDNFTTSWRDGRLFNAVIHKHQPRLVDMGKVYRQTNLENLEQAFSVAEKDLGVTRLLDPEDVDVAHPDEKSIITYVSSLYDAMPRGPEAHEGSSQLEIRWQEYYERVTVLLQWMRHHIHIFEERKFPGSYEEIELLWRQFLKFKETELPARDAEKIHSAQIYNTFEGAVHAGQVKVPPGYHPIDVDKEWGRLHMSILEREKLLRIEFERLERLQRIVTKVQMESGSCEEQLNQLESQMQTDIRLQNSGKPARHTAEVERDLDKADGMIRLLFNDVQFLKDGRHLQAEQIYRRVYHLHERLVNLRSDHSLRQKMTMTVTQTTQMTQQSGAKVRPELDDVTLRYAQDLLAWVEENQRRIEESEWGSDLPTVESHLGSHRGLHQSVEDFRAKIERAKSDEGQLSPVSKGTYRDYLGKLELQYAKLLNSSKSRLRHLESLNGFVSAATKELMWLNDKEEEEVNFDWSDRNTNMTAKKDNYSGLMRELELREKKINDIQTTGERMIREGHQGKKTVEAFTAALQTQWSWILQLCCCIEAHLKENTAHYQFFADVKDTQEMMRKMQDNIKKKYSCDRSTTATRLEDLLQDAAEEKEQLNEVLTNVSSLNKRARSIIQLKPRNPTAAIKGKLPIQAVCDFKQSEITVHKGDECALLNNSQPFKWNVLNRSGNEAVVPSVCFMVPPVNKDAMDCVTSLDTSHQLMVTMWQRLHIDMKCLLSWQYLMRDITLIRSWNITMFKSMKPEEYHLMIRNYQIHYQDFLRDSQESQQFGPDDHLQVEGEYNKTSQYFDNLLNSMEQGSVVFKPKGEQNESVCKSYTSQLKDLRVRIEDCETHTVNRIRRPLGEEPLRECLLKTTQQKKEHNELDRIKKEVDAVSLKTQVVLSSPQQPAAAPALRSELQVTVQKMDHAHMLSSVYLEKLKTVDLVIRSSQGAEEVLKKYEDALRDVQTVPNDVEEVEACRTKLKNLRAAAEAEQPVFDSLEAELKKASGASERMSRVHSERDVDLDHYGRHLTGLRDRWRAAFAQMDLRHRELEQLGRQLGYYRQSYAWLIRWIGDAKERQENIQAVSISDSKTLKEQLAQEKKLLEEIENNKDKVDECHSYAKAYIDTIKDYELQLVAYKAQYVTLRTRYSELTTLNSQYIKFIIDTQRRLENDEKAAQKHKVEEQRKFAEMQAELAKQKQLAESHAKAIAKAEQEALELKLKMQEEVSRREIVAVDAQKQKHNIQLQLHELKNLSEQQMKDKSHQVDEALHSRTKIEEEIHIIRIQLETTVKQKSVAESELKQLRHKAEEAERLRKAAQEEAEKLRKQVNEETQKKRAAEEELKLKSEAEKEAAKQKQQALEDLEDLKMQAEEAVRQMKQAEIEKERQIKVAHQAAQKSAAVELQSKRMSFVEKTTKLEESLKQEHGTVLQLQQDAARLKKQQEEAEAAREEAEKELEKWRQKANEALRLRLQAEEEAHQKSLTQEEAEKQKDEAEREAKKRAKAEESALKQKEIAESELERQRKLAEGTAEQKLNAEQELIRLRADFDHAEQQRSLLDTDLYRLKNEVCAAQQQRKQLEDDLAKMRSEMDVVIESKNKAEQESTSTTKKSKELLEVEAAKFKALAEEAGKLKSMADDAKRQRQVAEDEAARQRGEAERILKEKLAAINEATRSRTEAEISLKEKEAENERLRRQAEDEAYQRKALEDQANQHKQDIEQKIEDNLVQKKLKSEYEKAKKLAKQAEAAREKAEMEAALLHEVGDAVKQKAQVEEELFKVKVHMEELLKQKLRIEGENQRLIKKDKDNSQKFLKDEAENMKKLAEDAARLSIEAQEAASMRQKAEDELRHQRLLAEKMLKEKMQAIQEASKLKAEAEMLQRQKDLAQQQAQKLLEDKQLMQQRLDEETVGYQKSLEAERRRQLEIIAESEQLKLMVSELSQGQSKAEEVAKKFKKQADAIAARLHETEIATKKEITVVQNLEVRQAKSSIEADDLRKAIADLENEKTRLKEEAEELQNKSKEISKAQQKHVENEKAVLQQSFLTEKQMLLKKEKLIEDEKNKLESQFEEEVKKAKALQEEQERQRKQMEAEKKKLQANMDAALNKQKEAEVEMFNKQKEMQALERQRLEQERVLADENQKLRDKLQQLERDQQTKELEIQAQKASATQMVDPTKNVLNGQSGDYVDSVKVDPLAFDGIREKVPASRLHEVGLLTKKEFDKLKKGKTNVAYKRGLFDEEMNEILTDPSDDTKGFFDPNTEENLTYLGLMEKCITDPHTGMVLLLLKEKKQDKKSSSKSSVRKRRVVIVDPETRREMTVYEAYKKGLIDHQTYLELAEHEYQRYGTDSDDLSQWQCEFRGQIRALRHWLKSMEMKLPPLEPTVSFYCL
ncbi:hypothetical protein NHX12_001502 [Muraenolepis orangiensis]|uniref:Plectin-like n=1 Tax=Muraenolepis orangiensis TaxID=630683 RepID=A0A9Q0IF10_9TELE|nr:hypothetical protein NHX12_001502 [Muraenolepis orangiensis]